MDDQPQLVEQVAVPAAIPQMMMRIDDLERRFEDLLLAFRPPYGVAIARCGRGGGGGGRNTGLSVRRDRGKRRGA